MFKELKDRLKTMNKNYKIIRFEKFKVRLSGKLYRDSESIRELEFLGK